MADKSEEYILGIEIAEGSLRMVQRHLPTNTIDLVHIDPLSSDILTGDQLVQHLKQVIRIYRKLLKARYVVISLPYTMAIIRMLMLDGDSGDLKEQIEWEIEQEAVGKTSKYLFDWIDMASSEESAATTNEKAEDVSLEIEESDLEKELAEEMKVEGEDSPGAKEKSAIKPPAAAPIKSSNRYLVVAVEEDRIKWVEDSIKKLKLIPIVCDVDALALINAFSHNYPEDLQGNSALVYLTGSHALLVFTENGKYLDSDSVGRIKFDSPESARISIGSIEGKINELAAAMKSPVKRCFICGDAAADSNIRDIILSSFTLPAEILNPFRSILISQEIKSQVLLVSPALAVVTGLTLRSQEEV